MNRKEFIEWETDSGVVRMEGVDPDLLIVKQRGDDSGAIATREQYEDFELSFAHAWASGEIKRFGVTIGTLNDLRIVREITS